MTVSAARPEREKVAAWPRASAVVRPDGTGSITLNGVERPCLAGSAEELRTGVISRCAALARRLSRPVRLTVTEGASTWTLAVRGEGVVQLVADDETIDPAGDLAPHEGRCRRCRRLQLVSVTACSQCGLEEPHRVEADPVDVRTVVPDAEVTIDRVPWVPSRPTDQSADATEPANDPPSAPDHRPSLRLTFSTQPALEVAGNVALGRDPEPVGGREPVRVTSPGQMLSRTHALVDVDDAGRILVTDQHSGNGIEAQTQPPMRLTPGTAYVVHAGTTLLLGDVAVVVDLGGSGQA